MIYLSFQEKEEFGDDASSPSVYNVAEANGPGENDSSIDNVHFLLTACQTEPALY